LTLTVLYCILDSASNLEQKCIFLLTGSWHDLIPTNPRKVIVGIGFQFVAYVLAAPQVAVVWEEGPIGLFEPGMIKRSGVIGFTWLQGTKLIYQGYSETPCKSR
jgi:hypothetical protein